MKSFCKLSFLHCVPNGTGTPPKQTTTSYKCQVCAFLWYGPSWRPAVQHVLGSQAKESWELAWKGAGESHKKVGLDV